MKNLFWVSLGLLTVLLHNQAFSAPAVLSSGGAYELDRSSRVARQYGLGTALRQAQTFGVQGTWDYSLHGGAIASYNLKDAASENLVLPAGAIITDCFFDVVKAMTSASSPSGGVDLTAQTYGDLKARASGSTYSNQVACIPTGSEAQMIKLTAARTIIFGISSEALTAGKVNVFIQYVLSDLN